MQEDFVHDINDCEIPAYLAFLTIIQNNGRSVEHLAGYHPAIMIQRPQVDMEPTLFAISFWGYPGAVPDPYPNIVFSEFRQPGPKPTIWIGFSHSGVYLGGSPAAEGFREHIETKIEGVLCFYLKAAILLHAGKHNN